MNEYWELHECERLPRNGIQILYSMYEAERKSKVWRLIIRREATDEDLMDNTVFEAEGDTVWETYLEITHCPFCGKALYENGVNEPEDFGRFVHYDYSGWSSKRQ